MNMRENIVNYLCDKNYMMCLYDDFVYFFNYKYLDSFGENEIVVSLRDRKITLKGSSLIIVKMTKEELLIRGQVADVKVSIKDE